ncbi:MAG: energy transducer TonB [Acidobacteriaceae bacterium]
MLFSQTSTNPPRRAGMVASAAAHATLFLLVALLTLHFSRVRAVYRQSRCCSAALYWTGAVGADTPKDKPAAQTKSPRPSHRHAVKTTSNASPLALAKAAQSVPGVVKPQQQPTPGTGAGDADAEPPFPIYYPRPAVTDRSLLPAVERKIIVNVSISAHGDVTDEKLMQGLGNPLDQIVLDTVKSWRFRPATLNGAAVASTEQLVFPFNREFGLDDGGTNPS